MIDSNAKLSDFILGKVCFGCGFSLQQLEGALGSGKLHI